VHGNEVIAAITQPDGTGSIQVLAPQDGFLMLLRRDARVAQGDTVCIVATPEGS
jgi:predicted deacylase